MDCLLVVEHLLGFIGDLLLGLLMLFTSLFKYDTGLLRLLGEVFTFADTYSLSKKWLLHCLVCHRAHPVNSVCK